jgi:hypothetical protein
VGPRDRRHRVSIQDSSFDEGASLEDDLDVLPGLYTPFYPGSIPLSFHPNPMGLVARQRNAEPTFAVSTGAQWRLWGSQRGRLGEYKGSLHRIVLAVENGALKNRRWRSRGPLLRRRTLKSGEKENKEQE